MGSGALGLEFRAEGLGCRVQGLEFGVWGIGLNRG